MNISKRVSEMQFSPIRKFNPIAIKAEADGKKVYHLNIGQPDIETPAVFMDAIRAYKPKVIAYGESAGLPILQDAIIEYYGKIGVELERKDIIVTTGGSEALLMAFLSVMNDGDQVLMAEPFYTNYNTFAKEAGGSVAPITTVAADGFAYAKKDLLEKSLTPNTKAIGCITPGNPTGNVLTHEDMKVICEFAKEHDLWIIADEVYREFVYDGRELASFGQMTDYLDRIILIDSVSKRFSACGARIGCIISKNEELMAGVMKIAQGRLCSSTIDQVGAAALYTVPQSYYEEVNKEYCARRDTVHAELMKIPGVICEKPGGAFYMTVKLPVEDAEDFLMFLLTEFDDNGETVMFAPASGFYATPNIGKDEIRIAYILKQEDLVRAAQLIDLGLKAYNKKLGK
ncbi:MAG: pyridoxal phosphate-dependent aminotransferase [Eubacterium sp.]|nr:pyridoxal phosphate-dependent aminotransferase [Eubacterium sp.]